MTAPGMAARGDWELCWSAPYHRRRDSGFKRAADRRQTVTTRKVSVIIQLRLFLLA
ncbi:MAG TPA: hypothetical protein VGM65_13345 [Candidatus Udaeobacter sp.]|jgi:hypothetical protein